MLKLDVAQAVIAEALKTGGDFAEIFLEDRLNNNLSMLSGRVESVNSAASTALVFACLTVFRACMCTPTIPAWKACLPVPSGLLPP